MDLTTAYAILGVPENASLDQVKVRYRERAKQLHPDTSKTADAQPFILLTTAYTLIAESLTASSGRTAEVTTDIFDEAHIDEQINMSFLKMRKAYEEFYKQAVADAKENIRYCIHVAGSSSDLDTAVKERIKDLWVELVNDIESEVDRLCKRAKVADDEFLFSLFRDLYTARRRYWWATLYRNSFLLVSFLVPTVCVVLPNPPAIVFKQPYLLFIPLALCLVALIFQYRGLNPKRQFMPPRFSSAGIQATISAAAKNIGIDRMTATTGGVGAGAIIGTFIAPGVGTLIGAGVGALVGLFAGENLDNIKERVEAQIIGDLNAGIQQLNRRILAWIEEQRVYVVKAARDSFTQNIQKVGKLLTHRGFTRQVTSKSRLLLPGPTVAGRASATSEVPPVKPMPDPRPIRPIGVLFGATVLSVSIIFTTIQVWEMNNMSIARLSAVFVEGFSALGCENPYSPFRRLPPCLRRSK